MLSPQATGMISPTFIHLNDWFPREAQHKLPHPPPHLFSDGRAGVGLMHPRRLCIHKSVPLCTDGFKESKEETKEG